MGWAPCAPGMGCLMGGICPHRQPTTELSCVLLSSGRHPRRVRQRGEVGKMKCVILPSIATSIFDVTNEVTIRVRKITFGELVEALKSCSTTVNYVRHPPTNRILANYVTFVTGAEYRIANDRIFIVGLKFRTPTSGQDVDVKPDDLLILAVDVLSIA